MTDIDRIDQSVEIDDTLLSFIDLYRFYRFHRFYLKIHLFFCSVSSKNENWFHANSEFVDNGIAIESRRIRQFIITLLKKKFKKSYIFFKTRFKVSFWWPILARFVGAQFFHDLDLPPFQNNISSTCSYLPKSIKIVSDQVILSSNNGKQWRAI